MIRLACIHRLEFSMMCRYLSDLTHTYCRICQLNRGDPQTEVEFDRSCVGCELRRIHRQADEVCMYVPLKGGKQIN